MSVWKYSGLGMLVILKPVRIIFFIVVWNILCGIGMLLNGGMGPVKTLGGYFGFALAGAFAAYSGLAPVVNIQIRQRWCRPDSDFEKGRFGLVMLGLQGFTFTLLGLGALLIYFGNLSLSPVLEQYGVLALIVTLMILVFVFGIKRKKNRITKESMRCGTPRTRLLTLVF